MVKRALMVATVPSMIGQFNMSNIHLLLELGYEVDVACDFSDTSVWPSERVQGFKDELQELGVNSYQLDFSRSFLKIKRHIKSYQETLSLLKERQYSFIHTHTPIASAIVRLAAHKTDTRVVYTAHGFHFFTGAPFKNWLIFYPVEWWLSRYTDVLVTINQEDYKRASKRFHAKETVYIPGIGVDTDKFSVCKVDRRQKRKELGVKDDDFLLLSVCEISKDSQGTVIEALANLKEEGIIDNIVYLVVSKEDIQEEIGYLTRKYGLEGHVKFIGSRTDIDELCETVDCFVHLNGRLQESLSSLEAMAAGKPLIYADANGTDKNVGAEVAGCCIESTNTAAVASAIKKMRDDEAFRTGCGRINYRNAKNLGVQDIEEPLQSNDLRGYKHLQSIIIRQTKREDLRLSKDDYVVISVGELNDNKNHQAIIEVLPELPENVKYVIVGQGIKGDQLKLLSEKWGISERVRLTGFRTDVRDLLFAADCFAFPSKREGLGIAALEGLTAGLPVIGHHIGGIPDFVIDGETGWLCSEENYKEGIKKTIEYDWNHELMSKMAARFDKTVTNEIMKGVYGRYER